MLTDEELDAVCEQWRTKSARAKAATVKKAERLRAKAHAAPPFLPPPLETWRLHSQELSEQLANEGNVPLNDVGDTEAPAVEVAILEKLFTSKKVKAWDRACRVIWSGLCDPDIAADLEMRSLFRNLLSGLADTADGISHGTDPEFGAASFLVQDYLVTSKIEKEVLSRAGRIHGRKPHINHAQAAARVPELWAEMNGKGLSKTAAAPLIAKEVKLSASTVRKKLQGI